MNPNPTNEERVLALESENPAKTADPTHTQAMGRGTSSSAQTSAPRAKTWAETKVGKFFIAYDFAEALNEFRELERQAHSAWLHDQKTAETAAPAFPNGVQDWEYAQQKSGARNVSAHSLGEGRDFIVEEILLEFDPNEERWAVLYPVEQVEGILFNRDADGVWKTIDDN